MVAITPDRALPSQDAIDGKGGANGKAAYAGNESAVSVGLDNCVQVIRLHRKRHDSEVAVGSSSDR